jgi:N-sulfoglucosamine sulfohydrolase
MKKLPRCFLVALVGLNSMSLTATAAERNILLIVSDDQSKTLGCYGDSVAVTPAIDELARQSTVFTRAYATTASCSASRSVILSGLYNHANGQFGHAHHYHKFTTFQDVVSLSLPNALGRLGYRTARVGKYHVAPESVYQFEEVITGRFSNRNNVAMADACADFIAADDDRPFFLYYATNDPHRGPDDDTSSGDRWPANLFGNLPDDGKYPDVNEVFYGPDDVIVPPFLPDTPESRKELAQYYQSVARVDQGVARLLKLLKDQGVLDKTMIVFTADHGMAFPGAKTTTYEAGLQVPFVVYNPYGKRQRVENDALINHADITPSLLDFAQGLDQKLNRPKAWIKPADYWAQFPEQALENRNAGLPFDRYHGRSWLELFDTADPRGRNQTFASHTFHEITMYYPMRVVLDRDYKLIWNIAHSLPYPFASDLWAASTWQAQYEQGEATAYGTKTVGDYLHRPAFELFDLRTDPWEGKNLAADPAYAEILAAYQEKLKAFQRETDDPWILKWQYE